jgi:hypothetical protein
MPRETREGPEDQAPKDDLRGKGPDQLSPGQALHESLGASGSQRVGDSGPVANPEVSFPGEAEPHEAPEPER